MGKFNETLLPEKEHFYSQLNMEDITDAFYQHTKTLCKAFERKNLGKNHYVYVQSYTLFLANLLKKFSNMCLSKLWTWSWFNNMPSRKKFLDVINDRKRY